MTRVRILQQGTIHCFPAGLKDSDGNYVNVEVSAVAYDGKSLMLASDKPIPGEGRSAVFKLPLDSSGPDDTRLEYLTQAKIKQAVKYEDFALTTNGRYMIATTGFDRIDDHTHDLNDYNHLLVWPVGEPEQVQVVDPDPRDGVEGSLELRRKMTAAVGDPYYKIEGLAAIPSDKGDGLLLFGIREQGKAHDDFTYQRRVIGAHFIVNDSHNLEFIDALHDVYSFDPCDHEGVRYECALSSIEYDPYHGQIYLLTSFETEIDGEEVIGGYLWVMSLEDFHEGKEPTLVTLEDGTSLEFEHKAEGLAVLDRERLFVAYDNDRNHQLGSVDERDERHSCEALYTILGLA